MVKPHSFCWLAAICLFIVPAIAHAQEAGAINGVVYDKDFDAPLALAQVTISELGQKITADDRGHYVFNAVPPGQYTLIFAKDGYTRQIKTNVIVNAGKITPVDAQLTGEFADMDEFVVQDVRIGGGTEEGLLLLRQQSSAILDLVGQDIISKSGYGNVADILKLVSGTTVSEGKYATVRGLPDRYVVSQMNGVRLPTADIDKRAVELDQYPASVVESIQVSKTFTPDQQGDASGGAVNIVLKGIPEENILKFSSQYTYNTQTPGKGEFLTYKGGGANFWGIDDGGRDPQVEFNNFPTSDGLYRGAAGVSRGDAPPEYKWSLTAGAKHQFDNGVKIGGLVDFFYEQSMSYYENGKDEHWGLRLTDPIVARPTLSGGESRLVTKLYDVDRGDEEVKWGGLGTFGIESENHSLKFVYLYTRTAQDTARLAEDTRGRAYVTSHLADYSDKDTSYSHWPPYVRIESLDYKERTTQTMQLSGKHKFPLWGDQLAIGELVELLPPELDWTVAKSSATLDEPDRRLLGSQWIDRGWSNAIIGFPFSPVYSFYDASGFALSANYLRSWKDITEDSTQYFANLKFPFKQWDDREGYLKIGLFHDKTDREYNQDTYGNFAANGVSGADNVGTYSGADFNQSYSDWFATHPHVVQPYTGDVDYLGNQQIGAIYWMVDLPLTSFFEVVGGIRYETTNLKTTISADSFIPGVTQTGQPEWIPRDPVTQAIPAGVTEAQPLTDPSVANVDFHQYDILPAISFIFTPIEQVKIRASYTETVARQTFKELTPVLQSETLGSDVFIGDPYLRMSALKNYDLRIDYTPYPGGLLSASYFYKQIKDPIEYVQFGFKNGLTVTTPVNYPEGTLSGFEFEARQSLGQFWEELQGLSIGGNLTLIDSQVTLPEHEINQFRTAFPGLNLPHTRDMTNAPEYLYNLFLTYDLESTGTSLSVFYTVKGDTLISGPGIDGSDFVPSVYDTQYDTLNVSLTQKIGEHIKLSFAAKNLTDPAIKQVYRSEFNPNGDITKTSYKKGIDFSIGIRAEFQF